jgi:hypothetical protein
LIPKKSFRNHCAILISLGIVGLGTLAIFPILNIASANDPIVQSKQYLKQKGAVGSWSFIVKFTNGSQDRSLGAFTSDGIAIAANTRIKTPGFGVWQSTGANTFTYKLREPIYDTNGNLFGEIYVVQEAVLNSTNDEFNSVGKATLYDLSGNIISVETTTVQGTRIGAENP